MYLPALFSFKQQRKTYNMISPLNTIIRNNGTVSRRYRFTYFGISLGAAGSGMETFKCNGDVFTKLENNSEAEILLVDHKVGRISISYELDNDFSAVSEKDVVTLSGRAQLMLRRAETKDGVTSVQEKEDTPAVTTFVKEFAPEDEGSGDDVNASPKTVNSDPVYKGMFTAEAPEPPKDSAGGNADVLGDRDPYQEPVKKEVSGIDDLPIQPFGMPAGKKNNTPQSMDDMPTVEFGTDKGMKKALNSEKDLPVIGIGDQPKGRRGRKPAASKTIKVE